MAREQGHSTLQKLGRQKCLPYFSCFAAPIWNRGRVASDLGHWALLAKLGIFMVIANEELNDPGQATKHVDTFRVRKYYHISPFFQRTQV